MSVYLSRRDRSQRETTIGNTSPQQVRSARSSIWTVGGRRSAKRVEVPSEGLRRAIDEGLIPGPRIYVPAMQYISQTSGHGDMRSGYAAPHPNDLPIEPWHNQEFSGLPMVCRRFGALCAKAYAAGRSISR